MIVALVMVAITFNAPGIVMAMAPLAGFLTSKNLKEKRTKLVEELEGIISLAKEEKRDFSEDETSRRSEIRKEIQQLDADIEQREFEEAIETRKAGKHFKKTGEEKRDEEISEFSLLRAMQVVMDGKSLDGLEGEMHQEARKEMRESGINPEGQLFVPSMVIARKKSKEGLAEKRAVLLAGSGGGANLVQTEVVDFIEALYDKNVLVSLGAKMITGLVGNQSIPKSGGATGAWEGEVDDNIDGTPTLTAIGASPKRLGAFGVVSKTLIAQAGNYDAEKLVQDDITNVITQLLQIAAIEGSGQNGQPLGLLNTVGIGSVIGGTNGAAPDGDDIIDLESKPAIAKADMGDLAYLTNPKVRATLKKTVLDVGSGQFVWDRRERNELNSYPAGVTTSVPSDLVKGDGTDLSAIIFGNFSMMNILQWAGLDIVLDPYTSAKSNQVNIVINSFWDIVIRQAAAFAAMKDAITS